ARSIKLRDPLGRVGGGLHRQEAVVAEVDRDAQALVEDEAFALHLGVEALDLARGADEAQRAARGVEGAVAEELLELEEVALGDGFETALKAEHLPVRAHLLLASAAADVAEGFGERGDVVDQAEAMDDGIDDAAAAEIHRTPRA